MMRWAESVTSGEPNYRGGPSKGMMPFPRNLRFPGISFLVRALAAALRTAKASAVAAIAALLLTACSDDRVAGGDGGGMETTNGITARVMKPDGSPGAGLTVKIRRADYIAGGPGPVAAQGRDTLTGPDGRFEVKGLEAGAYTVEAVESVEMADGSELAWVRQNVRLNAKDSLTDLGSNVLSGTGTLKGIVNVANLPADNHVRLGLYGLDRSAIAREDGSYAFEGLAPAEYEVLVYSDSLPVTGKAAVFASIHPASETSLDSVFLPMDYRSDSLAIAAYLVRQGIMDFDFAARTSVYTNRIRTLKLNGLGLTGLDPTIGRLFFIHSLYLDSNPLTALPDSLRRLNLQVLTLDSIQFTSLPPQVLEQTRLRHLSLSRTGLKDLPAGIAALTSLTTLHLEGNGMDTLPAPLFTLTSLTTLRISQNPQLGALPDAMASLKRLEQLYAFGSGLESLPDWITDLSGLMVLQAFANRFTALPENIGNLANLKVLTVGGNKLTTLPASIGQLKSLTVLKLANNALTSLPGSITALDPGDFDVTGNGLCETPAEIHAWLESHQPDYRSKQKGCP